MVQLMISSVENKKYTKYENIDQKLDKKGGKNCKHTTRKKRQGLQNILWYTTANDE